ncbi:MAG TPA: aspartate aminotransferase family protein [Candidatus Dormibacteraeota bacterium]|nr:aspartate aminotransferase family protein [Candidatus Dormibacteraeota bacterium]
MTDLAVRGENSAALWRERDAELLSPAYARYSDLVIDHALGAHLHTVDGRDVLDFGCGIGVTNLGHLHPAVVAAVHEQVDKLWHTSVTALSPRMVEAAAALVSVTPDGLDQVFLNNSGAEAVESSIKLARRATGRTEIIAFTGAFHGRTYGAVTLTASKAKYREGMGPFLPGVHHVRYPHCFRYCQHGPDQACPIARGDEIAHLFKTTVPADTVAAIIVEPLQGEGGVVVPPASFLPRLREICDANGILLVCDEVQSGFGRTGRFFCVEHTGVTPDIMCVAKAFGNGLPIAGLAATHAVMSKWHPGEHGTTYGGNAVACAAAVAVIETMRAERLPERAAALGKRALQRLSGWAEDIPEMGDVRGLGLMIGIEFRRGDQPAPEIAARVQRRCLERDLLLLTCGIDDNVIRLLPPLTIDEGDLESGLDILEECVREETAAR